MDATSPVSFLSPADWGHASMRQHWEELLRHRNRLEGIYQSPEWLEHLATHRPDQVVQLATVQGPDGRLRGLAPLRVGQYTLKFDVAARALAATPFKTAFLVGSQPLLPDDIGLHDALFEAIWQRLPDCECIYMDSVATDSFLWRYLHEYGDLAERFLLYVPDGSRQHHLIELPADFDTYLQKFSAKTRNTLRRKERRLAKVGEVEFQRVESVDQIPRFLASATAVSRQSWQHRVLGTRISAEPGQQARLEDLARRGLLRSYVLYCGGEPCAFVLGYQHNGTFQYVEVAYDQRYGEQKLSPSTVLLYRMIQDLIEYRPVQCLNFGVGDADYKRLFGNSSHSDATVLLLRPTLRNRLLKLGHLSFRSSVVGAKQVLEQLRRR